MNTKKNELIAFTIISCILAVSIFTSQPLNEITIYDFGGVYGVIGYLVVKRIVDAYYAQKR